MNYNYELHNNMSINVVFVLKGNLNEKNITNFILTDGKKITF